MEFSSYPPTLQGPTAGGNPLGYPSSSGGPDDATAQQFLADLLAGSKKKEYKNMGAALIGTLFNAVGGGLEALGVKGAGGIGTEIFGQSNPNSTRDLAYLLTHMMGSKQAEREMNKRFEFEKQKMEETNRVHMKMQELQEKLAIRKEEFDSAQQTRGIEATRAEGKEKRAADAESDVLKVNAQKEIEKQRSETEIEKAKIEAGGRAAGAGGKEAFNLKKMAYVVGADMAGAVKKDLPAGAGLLQSITGIINEPKYNEAVLQYGPVGALEPAGYLQKDKNGALVQSHKILKIVRANLSEQAPGNQLEADEIFGPQLQNAKQRIDAVAPMLGKQFPVLLDKADDMMVVANNYKGSLDDIASVMSSVYRTEKKNYETAQQHTAASGALLSSFEAKMTKPQSRVKGTEAYDAGGLNFGVSEEQAKMVRERVEQYSRKYMSADNTFNPVKAEADYKALSEAVQKDPLLSALMRQ